MPQAAESKIPRASERIWRSARELFYRQGIRAVGVDEIVSTAGVTKPSLYRAYASKDELARAYLEDYACRVWDRFDRVKAAHPDDAKAQLLAYFGEMAERVGEPGFRGCAISNAAVEYPLADHPARPFAEMHKAQLRQRFLELCEEAGAKQPARLADGLLLLIEGAFSAVQLFGPDGPQTAISDTAEILIEAAFRA